jgi:hypothetical protein
MPKFYSPDLGADPNSPFARDENQKLVRRSYWLDMSDRSLVLVMTAGIGSELNNEEKRLHLADIRREHLIDDVCPQEILPPER